MILLIACAIVCLVGIGRIFTGYDVGLGLAMVVIPILVAVAVVEHDKDMGFKPIREVSMTIPTDQSDPVELIDSTELTEADTGSASASELMTDWDEEEVPEPVKITIISDEELSDEEIHAIIEEIEEQEEEVAVIEYQDDM